MSNWFYYDENGEKISVTGGQLKWLAKNGKITPETIVETEDGKTAPARKVKGLTFVTPESTPSETAPVEPAQSVESEIYGVAAQPSKPSPFTASMPTPAAAPSESANPFTASMPAVAKSMDNPFTATMPAVAKQADSPFTATIPSPEIHTTPPTSDNPVHTLVGCLMLVGLCYLIYLGGSSVLSYFGGGGSFTAAERIEINEFLAEHEKTYGNDVKKTTTIGGWTLLHEAASEGNLAATKYCISKGANINAKTHSGQTPLHVAARYGLFLNRTDCDEIIRFLASKGADVNARNDDGHTPLEYAEEEALDLTKRGSMTRGGRIDEVVEILISVGGR